MNRLHPPRMASRILIWISQAENRLSILGDYEEIYTDLFIKQGRISARAWYWSQVIKSFPMFIFNQIYGSAAMLKNYLKIALRNILRQKRYALLNILGLAVGLASCLLIAGYVIHELSFESTHPDRDQIYRINGLIPMGGRVLHNAIVAAPVGPTVEESIPEIEESVRIRRQHNIPVQVQDREFKEEKIFIAGPEILKVFSIPLVSGNPQSALIAPFTLILDQTLATKYFGSQDPIGQTLRLTLDKTYNFQVTGVMEDMPSNTVLRTPMIASFATILQIRQEAMLKWNSWGSITTFVQISKGSDPEAVGSKITGLVRSHLDENEKEASYYLQPLGKIYINNTTHGMNNDLDNSGSLTRIYVFSAIALLILIIAAINFINLSTAKITGRMKEVGIRKTIGAIRSSLIRQFLLESLLLTSVAMTLGLLLFSLFKPRLDVYLGKTLNLGLLTTPWVLPATAAMVLLVGFLAGSYPAFYLSRFPAAIIFRSGISKIPSKSGLCRVLVGTQFFLAITLIVCTLVVLKQVKYSENKDLGFNKDNLVVLKNRDAHQLRNTIILKNQILNRTSVLAAASIDNFPSVQNRNISTYTTADKREEEGTIAQSLDVDPDFVPTMELQVIAGRNFEEGRTADKSAVLINEEAVSKFGLTNPVGSTIFRGDTSLNIIGVLKDWNTNSIHSAIYPIVVHSSDETASDLVLRLPSDLFGNVMTQIRKIWSTLIPDQIFDYAYADDLLLRAYDEEKRLATLLISFCQLTVFVACLGIFGLASFSAEQRTKEIGIRKVLGASVSGMVVLLTKGYTRWVLFANIIAWPTAYLLAKMWLRDFAYRTPIGIEPFIIAGLLALVVALLSVSFQTLKTALSNPSHSLRYE